MLQLTFYSSIALSSLLLSSHFVRCPVKLFNFIFSIFDVPIRLSVRTTMWTKCHLSGFFFPSQFAFEEGPDRFETFTVDVLCTI